MLPKSSRLNRIEFLQVKSHGQQIRTPNFSCIYQQNQNQKISVVTSSKLSKSAIIRNKLRRRIYATFEKSPLPIQAIIYPNIKMLNWPNEEIYTHLHQVLSNLTRAQSAPSV